MLLEDLVPMRATEHLQYDQDIHSHIHSDTMMALTNSLVVIHLYKMWGRSVERHHRISCELRYQCQAMQHVTVCDESC